MRRFVPGNEISPTDSRKVGFFVAKMSCFHSQIHRSAEGMPEEIEAPAPRSMLNDLPRFTASARTNASSSSRGNTEMADVQTLEFELMIASFASGKRRYANWEASVAQNKRGISVPSQRARWVEAKKRPSIIRLCGLLSGAQSRRGSEASGRRAFSSCALIRAKPAIQPARSFATCMRQFSGSFTSMRSTEPFCQRKPT